MQFTLRQVNVTNWSRDPLLRLSDAHRQKLDDAIVFSRQIVEDSMHLLRNYARHRAFASVDAGMAADFFAADDHKVVDEALGKYFGLDSASPTIDADVHTITNVFRSVDQGIAGAFDLVVGGIHDFDDIKSNVRDAVTSVRHGDFRGAVKDLKWIRVGTEGWVDPRNARRRIHLNHHSIASDSPGKIARIIVHEATHKFAGTKDLAYKDGGRLDALVQSHANLLNNADSYAWAGRRMWKRRRGLAGGV